MMESSKINSLIGDWTTKAMIQATLAVIIIAGGMFGFNQAMEYYYNSELLQTPCELCAELNPQHQECFTRKVLVENKYKINNEINWSKIEDSITPPSS